MEKTKKGKFELKHEKLINDIKSEKKDKKPFIHFCENFSMGGALSNHLFEVYWNDPKRREVFNKSNDLTNFFYSERKNRIKTKNALNLCIVGVMGTGKSYGLHEFSLGHQKDFRNLYRKRELFQTALDALDKLTDPINIHIAMEDNEFLKYLGIMGYGDLVARDESPRSSSTDSKVISDAILNIIEETRSNQNSFIIVTPNKKVAKGYCEEGIFHFFMETAGLNIKPNETKGMIRFIVRNQDFTPVGRIIVPIDFENELSKREGYDKKKDENIELIIASKGMVNAELYGDNNAKKDADRLLTFCYERNYLKRRDIELIAFEEYNQKAKQEKRLIDLIAGSGNHKQKVIQLVYKAILKGKLSIFDEDKKINVEDIIESGFIEHLVNFYNERIPPSMFINQKTQIPKRNVIEILKCIGYGMGQRDISNNIDGIHLGSVSDISVLFTNGKRSGVSIKDDWRLYKCYETWVSKLITNSILISGRGKIDLGYPHNEEIYPIEVKLFNQNINSKGMKKSKLHAYKEFKDKLDFFPVVARNFKKGDNDYIFKVSTKGDLTFNFRFKEEFLFRGDFNPSEYFKIKKKE